MGPGYRTPLGATEAEAARATSGEVRYNDESGRTGSIATLWSFIGRSGLPPFACGSSSASGRKATLGAKAEGSSSKADLISPHGFGDMWHVTGPGESWFYDEQGHQFFLNFRGKTILHNGRVQV